MQCIIPVTVLLAYCLSPLVPWCSCLVSSKFLLTCYYFLDLIQFLFLEKLTRRNQRKVESDLNIGLSAAFLHTQGNKLHLNIKRKDLIFCPSPLIVAIKNKDWDVGKVSNFHRIVFFLHYNLLYKIFSAFSLFCNIPRSG